MVQHIHARVMKWLSRQGLLRDADATNAAPELSPTEALTALGMQRGTVVTAREESGIPEEEPGAPPPPRVTDAVVHEGFNLHASVHLDANDDVGRERLARYLSRPAFSLARLRLRRDGTVSYRVKKAGRGRVKERIMTPVECLARLAAMVPPPRYPLTRLHGVLGPRHRWRERIVPRPPVPRRGCSPKARSPAPPPARDEERKPPRREPSGDGQAAFVLRAAVLTSSLTESGVAERVAPNILSIAHWERLGDGELYAPLSRLDWATLLKRTFAIDIRVCLRCGGRLLVRAIVTEPAVIAARLAALRRSRDPPADA